MLDNIFRFQCSNIHSSSQFRVTNHTQSPCRRQDKLSSSQFSVIQSQFSNLLVQISVEPMNGTYYNTSNQIEGNNLTGFYINLMSFLSSCSLYFHQPKLDFLISISDLQLQFNFLVGCFISLYGCSAYACIHCISIVPKLECLVS